MNSKEKILQILKDEIDVLEQTINEFVSNNKNVNFNKFNELKQSAIEECFIISEILTEDDCDVILNEYLRLHSDINADKKAPFYSLFVTFQQLKDMSDDELIQATIDSEKIIISDEVIEKIFDELSPIINFYK